jgi:sulfur-oxidizing protein SoxZ
MCAVSAFGKAWVRLSENPRRGQPVEVRAMIVHRHESGFRLDNVGRPIPRHIVDTFTCAYGDKEVFRAKLHPAISTNPYFVFYVVAERSDDLKFTWTDDHGNVASHTSRMEVAE